MTKKSRARQARDKRGVMPIGAIQQQQPIAPLATSTRRLVKAVTSALIDMQLEANRK